MKLAVVGAGWAGLAAAVRAVEAGQAVTVFEMAATPGGRARSVEAGAWALDNGQHILIGAYTRTLALMRTVGADADAALLRMPLSLLRADGRGLRMPPGAPWLAFARGVLSARGWPLRERVALLATAAGWARRGFRCDPTWTVERLCAPLGRAVRRELIEPLCVAALNTPASDASAAVLLRVLHDALFAGPGACDLLLPRQPLSMLLPQPAANWLSARGAVLGFGRRVQRVERDGPQWRVDGVPFDRVVLACTATEAARLAEPEAPAWSRRAAALAYEPIVTVYLDSPGARLPAPMTALEDGPQAPAQFAFDHGALGGPAGRLALAVSGAARWVDAGLDATGQAALRQAVAQLRLPQGTRVLRVLAEKRATFRCTPLLDRPPAAIAPGLGAAGDYVEGPYPATLEGAVRSGEAAASA